MAGFQREGRGGPAGGMLGSSELHSPRLRLSPLELSDLDELHRHWTERPVRRYLWDGEVISRADVREIIGRSAGMFSETGVGLWRVRDPGSQALVGCAGYWFFHDPPQLELIFSISPDKWGKGLAEEAARALIDFGFTTCNWPYIQASADAPNAASLRVIKKLGMQPSGQLPGAFGTIEVFRLSRSQWEDEQRPSPAERREGVPFDPYFFESERGRGRRYSISDTFRHIYRTNLWNADGSVSGAGAILEQTKTLVRELPRLLRDIKADSLLDVPCGDFGWMRYIDLPVLQYVGGDILPELIAENRRLYGRPACRFEVMDLTSDALPEADILLCRDVLVHMSFADIQRVLANIRRSPIEYFLTTTFPACRENEDIVTGDWRVLNLQAPPFEFPEPVRLINEGCTEGEGIFSDKSLGLWRVSDLP